MDRQAKARHGRNQRALPGHGLQHAVAADRAARGLDAGRATALDLNPGDFGVGMQLDATLGGPRRIGPHDRVVPGGRAGRVVERRQHRMPHVGGQIEAGRQLGDVVGEDQLGVHPEVFVHLGAPAHGADR